MTQWHELELGFDPRQLGPHYELYCPWEIIAYICYKLYGRCWGLLATRSWDRADLVLGTECLTSGRALSSAPPVPGNSFPTLRVVLGWRAWGTSHSWPLGLWHGAHSHLRPVLTPSLGQWLIQRSWLLKVLFTEVYNKGIVSQTVFFKIGMLYHSKKG